MRTIRFDRFVLLTVLACGLVACGSDGAENAGDTTVVTDGVEVTTTSQATTTTTAPPGASSETTRSSSGSAGSSAVSKPSGGAPGLSGAELTRNTADDEFCGSSNPGSFGVVLTASYTDQEGDAGSLWVDFGSGYVDHTAEARFGGDGAQGTVAFTICGFAGDPIAIAVADAAGNRSGEVRVTIPDE